MPIFKILLDSGHDTKDKLCQRFAGFYHYGAKRQPPDPDWVFTHEVYLGPALHSLVPPLAT